MADNPFTISSRFRRNLPIASRPWAGLPRYNFIGGHNDPDHIPVDDLAEAAAEVMKRDAAKLAIYNLGQGPLGYEPLRDFLVEKLKSRGVSCTRNNLLVTSGSGQGLELVNALFLEAGDTVLVEEFSFQGVFGRFRNIGVNVVAVPLGRDGMKIDVLSEILEGLAGRGVTPKFLYTIPSIQNPTGTILSLERRKELLSLAKRYGFVIFEDECYTDLLWGADNPPSLYGMDSSHVVHIGSFSKTLAPALRIGYILASEETILQILPLKNDGGTGAVDQLVAAEFFSRHFEPHVERLKKGLRGKLDTMLEAMNREFGSSAELWIPEGGIFLWFKLPDSVDSRALVAPAAKAGLVFNPGPEWACDPEAAKSYIRLCFALPTHEDIRAGVAELARICFEQTGIPPHSGNVARSNSA